MKERLKDLQQALSNNFDINFKYQDNYLIGYTKNNHTLICSITSTKYRVVGYTMPISKGMPDYIILGNAKPLMVFDTIDELIQFIKLEHPADIKLEYSI